MGGRPSPTPGASEQTTASRCSSRMVAKTTATTTPTWTTARYWGSPRARGGGITRRASKCRAISEDSEVTPIVPHAKEMCCKWTDIWVLSTEMVTKAKFLKDGKSCSFCVCKKVCNKLESKEQERERESKWERLCKWYILMCCVLLSNDDVVDDCDCDYNDEM